ncbi:BTAD domain-containing putative transcriptional regulator [Streptococcus porcinus]|uniref:Tetratricopeptide repeat protein n=2 Tax=Streptococcus porcinus TaxID=1340 RepID=A0A4V0HAE9_STRPO|nr:BTAD domain-containing putative transcriptional regulator [Streptococcus porcinus]EGJ27970.1 tetratricopeptide repeat protein [Streptococcus porcinus str. Jelinkova 176]SQG44687.1 tetratricopeptide repeat protein [Streptococcus porcinus]VTT44843.1 tetratricopeptide repeat protein [Streptococcus porcinus]VTT46281.1 tetratricopeptide repeat protein [Streptococcus porcinus]
MKTLRFTLLGNPSIHLDNQEIFFAFAKINALLYYLVINETTNRDEIAGILWEDKDNKTAKKNLRNSIYQVNKVLGDNYIISPNRTLLMFNPDLQVVSDVHYFLKKPLNNLGLYKGQFLQNFYLKANETFDLWLTKMRAHLEQIYIKSCYQQIDILMTQNRIEEIEERLQGLIAIDEFEEKNYQLLMKVYQKHHRYGKVIETYYKLANLLDVELGITPNDATQAIYEEVIAKDRNQQKIKQFLKTTNDFIGRLDVIKELETFFNSVYKEKKSHTMILIGGTGIGKRTVTRQVLSNQINHYQIVTSECFQGEPKQSLQILKDIFESLKDLILQYQLMSLNQWKRAYETFFPNYFLKDSHLSTPIFPADLFTSFMIDILKKISRQKATVLLIEDIHWITPEALTLLQTLVNHLEDDPIAFIFTKNLNSNPHLDQFFNHLVNRKKVDIIKIKELSEKESLTYLEQKLAGLNPPYKDYQRIYQWSEGNPFFLSEYVNQYLKGQKFSILTPAIEAKLSLKLKQVNSHEEELLCYLSCFQNAASISILSEIMNLPLALTISFIETLCNKQLIKEIFTGDEVTLIFKQKLLAHYCYQKMSVAKRRLLHAQIAKQLENMMQNTQFSAEQFEEIAFHFQEAKEPVQALQHQLNRLEATLQFQHELFPIYSQNPMEADCIDGKRHLLIQTQFNTIHQVIQQLRSKFEPVKSFQESLIRFLYIEGCYLIRIGQYQKGITNIQKVISAATEWHHTHYLLESYRQIIHYCIQVENISEMKYYTELALDAAVSANNYEAIAIQLRLSGLYFLMIGHIPKASQYLNQSISFFSLTSALQSKYAIQIAAAYDYLAEIEQIQGNLGKAIDFQNRAIQLSQNKRSRTSVISFYISLGISYYQSGEIDKAESILINAKEGLQSLRFPWKEVQLEVYLALINCEKGNYKPLIDLINKKEELMARYSNPRDKGMIYYIMALTKAKINSGKLNCLELTNLLKGELSYYLELSKNHLNPCRDRQHIKELERLEKMISHKNI